MPSARRSVGMNLRIFLCAAPAIALFTLPAGAQSGASAQPGLPSGTVSAAIEVNRPVGVSGIATEGAATFLIEDGVPRQLTEELTLRVRPDGTIIGFNGEAMTIPSGMMLTTDGRLVQRPNLGIPDGTAASGGASSSTSTSSEMNAGGAGINTGTAVEGSGQRGGATGDINQTGVSEVLVPGSTTGAAGTTTNQADLQQSTTTEPGASTNPQLGSPGSPANVDPNSPDFGTRTIPGDPTGRGTSQTVTEDTAPGATNSGGRSETSTGTQQGQQQQTGQGSDANSSGSGNAQPGSTGPSNSSGSSGAGNTGGSSGSGTNNSGGSSGSTGSGSGNTGGTGSGGTGGGAAGGSGGAGGG